jgi:hypothetical protein
MCALDGVLGGSRRPAQVCPVPWNGMNAEGASSPVPVLYDISRRSSLVQKHYIGTHCLMRRQRSHSKLLRATPTALLGPPRSVAPLSQPDRAWENRTKVRCGYRRRDRAVLNVRYV